MSSRSSGVTNVELSRWMMSWVIRSPSDSHLRMSRASPPSSGHRSSMSLSSRAERRLFWPASAKRSKKTLSRGTRESATGVKLAIVVG